MMEPIASRYTGPSNMCIYWDIFKKGDEETGYNGWKLISLLLKPKLYREADELEPWRLLCMALGDGWQIRCI